MARFEIFDTIERLRRTGAPFCVATVMRTADATSAKAGAKAAVTREGEILGHLGGACVQRAVRTAAAEAMAEGAPRVIRVKPSEKVVAMTDPDGAHLYKSGCPSGGTVDLLIEPYAHPPRLVVFGDTPIARAIAAHGALAGLRVARPIGIEAGTMSPRSPAPPAGQCRLLHRPAGPAAGQEDGELRRSRHLSSLLRRCDRRPGHDPDLLSLRRMRAPGRRGNGMAWPSPMPCRAAPSTAGWSAGLDGSTSTARGALRRAGHHARDPDGRRWNSSRAGQGDAAPDGFHSVTLCLADPRPPRGC
jgi:hypothetical protein